MLLRMLIHSVIFTVLITVGAMSANATGLLNGGFGGSSFSLSWSDDHDRRYDYGRVGDRKWKHDDD